MMLLHPTATVIMFCSRFRCLPTRRLLNPIIRKSSLSSSAHHQLTMSTSNDDCDASTLFLQRQTEPKKNIYTLSDIIHYLNQIQEILESSIPLSPAIKYEHCYQSDNNTTFFKVVGNVLAKPMLRTLIYNDQTSWYNTRTTQSKKIHFDQRIREEKAALEFDRMYSFVVNTLRPAALLLDEDLRNTFIPDLLNQIDMIEQKVQDEDLASKLTGWSGLFCRLASGRYYQGKLDAMICDLFPRHLDEFYAASRKVTEREVLERVIQLDLVDGLTNNRETMSKDEEAWIERRINAARKCLDKFYYSGDDNDEESTQYLSRQDHLEGIRSGKRCERSCLEFLQDVYNNVNGTNTHRILTNVYINNRRKPYSESAQKYIPPKMLRRGASPKDKELGIIWTDRSSPGIMSNRHRECSEFDAVILKLSGDQEVSMNGTATPYAAIESIFEAKRTISPSTLHDILMKKLGAIEALLDDTSAELAYRDGDGIMGTAPLSSDTTPSFTFGIYGVELLPPGNAADSIRSIAGSNIVSSNIYEVVCALERGSYDEYSSVMVEVEVASTIEIVENLKALIEEKIQNNRVDIVFILEEEACFLRS
ncbi:hypothetical protein ACHAXM_000374 [Skeletonema potamos]